MKSTNTLLIFSFLLTSFFCSGQAILITDSMHVPRVSHELQPLGNGKFLVMGGRNTSKGPGFYIEKSCEIYDANTGTWYMTDSLQYARSQFTSVVTTGGKVLAIGGETTVDGPVLNTEVFDPVTETWSVAGTAPGMSKCDAVVTSTGEILVSRYTKLYKGTPDGSVFTDITPAQHVSSGEFPKCIELNSGTILCAGTQPSTNNDFGVEYNNFIGTTTNFRTGNGTGNLMALLPNGKVLMAGPKGQGAKLSEIYDPATQSFTPADTFSRSISGDLMPMSDGRIAVMMHNDLFGVTGPGTKILEIYDPSTDTWTQSAPHYIENTLGAISVNMGNGKYLICGGIDNFQSLNSGSRAAFIFDENGTPTVSLKEYPEWPIDISSDQEAGVLRIWGADTELQKAKTVKLYNLNGQLLFEQQVNNQREIIVPAMPLGVYLVQLIHVDNQALISRKVVF